VSPLPALPRFLGTTPLICLVLTALLPAPAESACCFVAAKGQAVELTALKVFVGWDAGTKKETLILQPAFEGPTADFGMIVATPARPEVGAAPRDFFQALGVITLLKRRVQPESRLLPLDESPFGVKPGAEGKRRPGNVKVLDEGLAKTLAFKVITADQTGDMAAWLKENHYAADETVLDFYVRKKWCFTVLKIDSRKLTKNADGTFTGAVVPLRFTFATEQPIVPLRLASCSVKDEVEMSCTVEAPTKVDLPGELSYQFQWVPMLRNAVGAYPKGTFTAGNLPGKGDDWLKAIEKDIPALLKQGQELGFGFANNRRPLPNKMGRTAATLEWAKRLTAADLHLLTGKAPLGDTVPDPDDGFTQADVKSARRAEAVYQVIRRRIDKLRKERPGGYLVREAPAPMLSKLPELQPFLHAGQFVTSFRKALTRDELKDDVLLEPAQRGAAQDPSEYEELLPTSPL
jgi:hypothetical protein